MTSHDPSSPATLQKGTGLATAALILGCIAAFFFAFTWIVAAEHPLGAMASSLFGMTLGLLGAIFAGASLGTRRPARGVAWVGMLASVASVTGSLIPGAAP